MSLLDDTLRQFHATTVANATTQDTAGEVVDQVEKAAMEKEAEAKRRTLAISKILAISVSIKISHIKTMSYAKHMALDTLFEDLSEKFDTFIECVQGYYRRKDGHQPDLVGPEKESIEYFSDGDLVPAIGRLEDQFRAASDPLVKGISPLVSLQDDILNCFFQLYYRLDLKK